MAMGAELKKEHIIRELMEMLPAHGLRGNYQTGKRVYDASKNRTDRTKLFLQRPGAGGVNVARWVTLAEADGWVALAMARVEAADEGEATL
jgi:hypothetical protein